MSDKPKTYTLEISQAELVALVKWNMTQARSVSKRFGQEVLKIQARSLFGSSRAVMEFKKVCQDKILEHGQRANGLASLLK